MWNQEIIAGLFAIHFVLLIVKIWAIWISFSLIMFIKSNSQSFMLVFKFFNMLIFIFSILMAIAEFWFLYSFFVNVDLYYYEYMGILDEIIFTIAGINYLVKEDIMAKGRTNGATPRPPKK